MSCKPMLQILQNNVKLVTMETPSKNLSRGGSKGGAHAKTPHPTGQNFLNFMI